jgi:hypothetical protein
MPAAPLSRAEEYAREYARLSRAILPIVRHSRLLDDRITRTEGNLSAADDHRHLTPQNCHEVKRVGVMSFLEAIVLRIRGGAIRLGSYLDYPEARTSLRRLKRPFLHGGVQASFYWLGWIADP